ncbi:hypothetical protein MP478_04395 [Chryseobacterium sp. WG14]|uniref:hypothetical protein n=1 Tax=Chryseobacterium sp. WG14 TaxID=2926909 RepID=UPI00211E4AA1|nr:hypothetical protein [Chryseobacterium sp. WG14]MCQ9638620.1 hypothetical protein [Chryseobacterium sp. WG14]
MRIKQQNSLILATISALNNTVLGKGIKATHIIKISRGKYDSLLEFSRKDGQPMESLDCFMLGYFVGRDFDK